MDSNCITYFLFLTVLLKDRFPYDCNNKNGEDGGRQACR